MLHREIIQQRLEQDSDLNLVQTAPNVTYEIKKKDGTVVTVHGPQDVPDAGLIEEFREPIVKISFLIPAENIGVLMQMCTDRRGSFVRTEYLSQQRVILVYEMPLAEVIYDLYDKLKSVTHGYGTMDYEVLGFRAADLVKMDILVHGQKVDALSVIVHRTNAERRGRLILKKLREEIPRTSSRSPRPHRRARRRPREHRRHAQERDRQVLRRRHHPQAQAVGQGRGEEADEADRAGRGAAGGVPGGPGTGRVNAASRYQPA